MKTIILATAAALAFVGTASAQPQAPAAGGDITRAAVVADAERRFASLDSDGDGALAPAEMRQMFEQRRAQRLAQMSPEDRARFEQRRAERRAEGGGWRGERGERGERSVRGEGGERGGMRGPGAGPVTLAVFVARATERFDRLDLDRDGVITRAEQEQLRARRAAARAQ